LAERLIERLQRRPESRILDFGSGSGRNAEALRQAGFVVVTIDDRAAESEVPFAGIDGDFSAVLSTHGLLHGTSATIAAHVAAIAERIRERALFYATFGSRADARFGRGRRLDPWTYAPDGGDERGVAHAYFDRERLRALLEPRLEIESLDEHGVDGVAGAWAHRQAPLSGAVHWFAIARKR
jgi:SAM-dependent methyltransferase